VVNEVNNERPYWHRQTPEEPLFPDIIWSRPESKRARGKLLIVGGNIHGFSAAAEAYGAAQQAGIGSARVLLPDSLAKTLQKVFPAGEYAPSTPSGSFARTALGEIMAASEWADGILLAGDFGKNSETAILLEELINKFSGQLTITGDGLDYFMTSPAALLKRPQTTLVPNFAQLQRLAISAKFTKAITSQMDFLHLLDSLHDFIGEHSANMMLNHEQNIWVASSGRVSTTKVKSSLKDLQIAAAASVWWLQNSGKDFESLCCAAATSA
jgi:NAD(P)H-hydrate repair Nnr-like enzyme with NAD(P)H-hydrate dehydratase domain